MKRKLKRINRGVALTIIAVYIFIICTAVSNSSFKKHESGDIQTVLENYVEQMALCSVSSEGNSDFAKLSAQQAKKVVLDNWTDSEYLENFNETQIYTDNYYYLKNDVISDLGLSGNYFSGTDYIASITSDVSVSSIRKNGAAGATVEFKVKYKVTGSGSPGIYSLSGFYPIDGSLSADEQYTYSTEAIAQLYKEDGQWKIIGIECWGLWDDNVGMYDFL